MNTSIRGSAYVQVYHPELVCDGGIVDLDRRSPFPTLLLKHCGLKDVLFEPSGKFRLVLIAYCLLGCRRHCSPCAHSQYLVVFSLCRVAGFLSSCAQGATCIHDTCRLLSGGTVCVLWAVGACNCHFFLSLQMCFRRCCRHVTSRVRFNLALDYTSDDGPLPPSCIFTDSFSYHNTGRHALPPLKLPLDDNDDDNNNNQDDPSSNAPGPAGEVPADDAQL